MTETLNSRMLPSDQPTLGELMKHYEHAYRRRIEPTDYVLLRLDGKAFHSYTKRLAKPYDTFLMEAMDRTMLHLCEQVQGVRVGYVESDEISLLVTGFRDVEVSDANPAGVQQGQLWMGGVEAKMLSLSSAIATEVFNRVRAKQWAALSPVGYQGQQRIEDFHPSPALFDSRIWTFPGTEEGRSLVEQYFTWRYRDSVKNSVTMAALDKFSHRELMGVTTEVKREWLRDQDAAWEDLPDRFRFGHGARRVKRVETISFKHGKTGETETAEVERSSWETFVMDPRSDTFRAAIPAPPRTDS